VNTKFSKKFRVNIFFRKIQCCGSASRWCGCVSYLSLWCGSEFYLSIWSGSYPPLFPYLDPLMLQNDSLRLPSFHFDPDPAFHFDAHLDSTSQNYADPWGSGIRSTGKILTWFCDHPSLLKDVRAIAAHIAALPKVNSARPRTVIITQGAEPVIVVTGADRQVQELRIRIHFIRIRNQHFRLNTNPDPGLYWPKIGKKFQLKKNHPSTTL